LAKIRIDFFDFFGVGGAEWRCRTFFKKKKKTDVGFFFYMFYSVKLGTFFDDLTKSTLLAGGNSNSYGNFEILKFDRRI
jgi:hypothetical protein